MKKELIAEKLNSDLSQLSTYEGYYAEGGKGELRLYLEKELSEEELRDIESQILSKGVTLAEPIKQDARVVVISFQKAVAPLIILATTIGGIMAGILGWQLFREKLPSWSEKLEKPLGVPWWAWLLGIGSSVALYMAMAERTGGQKWLGKL